MKTNPLINELLAVNDQLTKIFTTTPLQSFDSYEWQRCIRVQKEISSLVGYLLDNCPSDAYFTYDIFDEVLEQSIGGSVCHYKIVATDPVAAVWKLLGNDLKNYDMGDMKLGEKCELRVMEEGGGENQDCGTLVLESNGTGGVWEWEWKQI